MIHHELLAAAVTALLSCLGFHEDDIRQRDEAQAAAVVVDHVHYVAVLPETREWIDARRSR